MSLDHPFTEAVASSLHPTRWLGGLVLIWGIGGAPASWAQTAAARPDFAAAAERAEREGNKVFRWILIQGEKAGRKEEAKAAAPNPAPAAAARPATPRRATAAATPERAKDPDRKPENAASSAEPARAAAPLPSLSTASKVMAVVPAASAPAQNLRELVASPAEPEEDQPLLLVHQVQPDYPRVLIRRIKKGSVQLRFEVLQDGSVKGVEVVESSNPRLNQAAVDAVAQWKFAPLRRAQVGMVELEFDVS